MWLKKVLTKLNVAFKIHTSSAANQPETTMKLSVKASKRIASLFNSIQVGEEMQQQARFKGDLADQYLWGLHFMKATIALYDEFGIELVNYQSFVDAHPQQERVYRELREKQAA